MRRERTAVSGQQQQKILMEALVSVVVVTSPAPHHPMTVMIEEVVQSLNLMAGAELCNVCIVLDGYVIGPESRTKRGRITSELAQSYERYHQRLLEVFPGPKFKILRSECHIGFALAVKWGLESCETPYALIVQHDRQFHTKFSKLKELIDVMENDDTIRYIGFPTVTNMTHDQQLHSRYHLSCLNSPKARIPICENVCLQPLVFWFDSNHLGHVKRYLEIFTPYRHMPEEMREKIDLGVFRDMIMRKGDFIEDRFGQMQRRILTNMHGQDEDTIIQTFRWFGSYLVWCDCGDGGAQILVAHKRGRKFDPARALEWQQTTSLRLERLASLNAVPPSPNTPFAMAQVDESLSDLLMAHVSEGSEEGDG